jgi:hypothetical protein
MTRDREQALMINNVSSIKGIIAESICMLVFFLLVVFLLVTQNFIMLPGLMLMLCISLAGTVIFSQVADLNIEGDELQIVTLLKIKRIKIDELVLRGMEKPSQGMFYIHSNFGFLILNFNYKNYQELIRIISTCKNSNITIDQFKMSVGGKFNHKKM